MKILLDTNHAGFLCFIGNLRVLTPKYGRKQL